jgi:hypothetical protein
MLQTDYSISKSEYLWATVDIYALRKNNQYSVVAPPGLEKN